MVTIYYTEKVQSQSFPDVVHENPEEKKVVLQSGDEYREWMQQQEEDGIIIDVINFS